MAASSEGNRSIHFSVLVRLIPEHIKFIRIVWIFVHVELFMNEATGVLARASLQCPAIEVLPSIGFLQIFRAYAAAEFFVEQPRI